MVIFFKLQKKYQTLAVLLLLLILLIPTFWRLLRPGIFSMQDLHIFRVYEYHKCVQDLQIPCRWAPDAGFEYGEPLFNFYGQLPYAFGESFLLLGFSFLDTLKALFISSLVLSALSMFLLGKQLWKNNIGALISALVYVYAPYRAVDVFVRGALPESFAFIFYPLIIYFFNDYVQKRKSVSLLFLGLSLSGLILTHNLSAMMFLLFIGIWGSFILFREKAWNLLPKLLAAGLLSLGLASFYLLPVVLESQFVTIQETIKGYFNFVNHYVTLNQLLISRFWGYGGSTWGEADGMSLSVGHVQWIIPILVFLMVLYKKSLRKFISLLVLLVIGWVALLLTHNKSTFAWTLILPMKYIQFPWRFLAIAVFSFALGSGAISLFLSNSLKKYLIALLLVILLLVLNSGFFFEDLWFPITDKEQFGGLTWEQQLIASSLHDYWPTYGKKAPSGPAFKEPIFLEGTGSANLVKKTSKELTFKMNVVSQEAVLQLPLVFFPGWVAHSAGEELNIRPEGELGLVTLNVKQGTRQITLKFEDTAPRRVGNIISLSSAFLFIGAYFWLRKKN